MNTDDKYREKAEEAKRQADLAANELDREAWLRLARDWLALLRKPPRSDDEDAG
jgi:hypothetical protein